MPEDSTELGEADFLAQQIADVGKRLYAREHPMEKPLVLTREESVEIATQAMQMRVMAAAIRDGRR